MFILFFSELNFSQFLLYSQQQRAFPERNVITFDVIPSTHFPKDPGFQYVKLIVSQSMASCAFLIQYGHSLCTEVAVWASFKLECVKLKVI